MKSFIKVSIWKSKSLSRDQKRLVTSQLFEISRGKREVFSFVITNDLQVWDATRWKKDRETKLPYWIQVLSQLVLPQ